MKVAFSVSGNDLSALLDMRFGRCAGFLVLDTETNAFEVVPNQQNAQAAQGAGIQAAECVLNTGADVLVSGHCGPKAFKVLQAGGVRIFNAESRPVADLVEAWKRGELVEAKAADVEGHW